MNVFEETVKKYIIEHGSPVELEFKDYDNSYDFKEDFWDPIGVNVIFDILPLVETRGFSVL